MRQSKTITIDDDRITVYELTVEEILAAIETDTAGQDAFMDQLPKCTDLAVNKMKKMAPSELKQVWDAFQEVNSVFFSVIETMGIIDQVLPQIRKAVVAEMEKSFPDLPSKNDSAG